MIQANDGGLLSTLPSSLSQIYPADPRYCSGTFHFDLDLSDDFEALMKSYANASFMAKKLLRKLGMTYTRKVDSYLSLSPAKEYVAFDEFCKGMTPPSAKAARVLFVHGFFSPNTPYEYSQYERIVREIQNVTLEEGDMLACDWTFQAVKNYNLPGAKALFTMNKGSTKEIVALVLVISTAISQVSHKLVEIMTKRPNFNPSVLYHDTCPNNGEFWKMLFGASVDVRLGLFHLLHRIIETLDNRSDLYWKCLVALKMLVYAYNDRDPASVLTALKEGTFGHDNKKHSDQDINELRHSKRWKERCDPLLRKQIRAGPIIAQGISDWIDDWENRQDAQGCSVFTRNTAKVAREQMKKVKYVEDPPGIEMYREIPAGKRSLHKLPKWLSNRPESGLEKFHELLAHMANTGSGIALADALTYTGTGDHNVKARWKARINKQKLEGKEINSTVEFEDKPQFWVLGSFLPPCAQLSGTKSRA